MKTLTVKKEIVLQTTPKIAFDSWLSPKTPGTIWHIAGKFLITPKLNGLYYWTHKSTAHYGRFTKFKKGSLLEQTWVSPYTEGLESVVKVTFKKKGKDTLMTLVHSGLPNNEKGKAHNGGWSFFMDEFKGQFE